MIVFTFAYRNEAQIFIRELQLLKHFNNLNLDIYAHSNMSLLITGQGIYNSVLKLSAFLAMSPQTTHVFNFGIAGKLSKSLDLNKVYPVNKVYHPGFKEYTLADFPDGINCVSSNKIVNDNQDAQSIRDFGQAVDMELWAVAMVSHFYKKKLTAAKIISDDASEKINLAAIKNRSKFYSEALFDYYRVHFNTIGT